MVEGNALAKEMVLQFWPILESGRVRDLALGVVGVCAKQVFDVAAFVGGEPGVGRAGSPPPKRAA